MMIRIRSIIAILIIESILRVPSVMAVEQIQAIEYPVDTTVVVGETVRFQCIVAEPATDNQILHWLVQWDNDTVALRRLSAQVETMVSASDRPEFSGRGTYSTEYTMDTEQDGTKIHSCILNIKDANLKDTGYFGCTHQIPESSHRTLLREKIRLSVTEEIPRPTTEVLSTGDMSHVRTTTMLISTPTVEGSYKQSKYTTKTIAVRTENNQQHTKMDQTFENCSQTSTPVIVGTTVCGILLLILIVLVLILLCRTRMKTDKQDDCYEVPPDANNPSTPATAIGSTRETPAVAFENETFDGTDNIESNYMPYTGSDYCEPYAELKTM